jgi:hypothetical protein
LTARKSVRYNRLRRLRFQKLRALGGAILTQLHPDVPGDDVSLLRLLRRRFPFIIGAPVLAGVVASLWSARQPVLYEAATNVTINPTDLSPSALVVAVANARALLESPALAASTLEKFNLGAPPESLSPSSFLRDRLTVTQVPDTSMLRLRLRLSTASSARQALAGFVTGAIEQNQRSVGELVRGSTATMGVELDEARQALERAARDLLAYQKSAHLERIRKDAEVALDERARAAQLRVEIEAERSRIAAAQKELSVRGPETEAGGSRSVTSRVGEGTGPQPQRLGNLDSVSEALSYDVSAGRARTLALETERRLLAGKKVDGSLTQLYDGELQLRRLESEYDIAEQLYKESAFRHEHVKRAAMARTFTMTIGEIAASDSSVAPQVALSGMVGVAVGLVASLFGLVASAYFPGYGSGAHRG